MHDNYIINSNAGDYRKTRAYKPTDNDIMLDYSVHRQQNNTEIYSKLYI